MVVHHSPKPGSRISLFVASVLVALFAFTTLADPLTIRQASGTSAADIQGAVDQFRSDLGTLNPNTAGSAGSGRREINWDGVPDARSAPNNLPADFFNVNSPRGVVFSTPGTGFQVSANAGVAPVRFDTINPGYSTIFNAFSQQRLFTAVGSNVVTVNFFVPGSTQGALVSGFGAVFTNVQLPNTTKIDYFDINGNLIGSAFAPSNATAGNFSFVGLSFANPIVASVRITNGNAALGAGVNNGGGVNLVVMDDFIYGEPISAVPEPSTLTLLLTGGAALAVRLKRRRSGSRNATGA